MKEHAEIPVTIFSRRLKDARKRIGISQKELGIRSGIDEYCASARINQYERGKHTPDFLTTKNLAEVLKLPACYFYTEDENLAELIQIFSQLPKKYRSQLIESAYIHLGTIK